MCNEKEKYQIKKSASKPTARSPFKSDIRRIPYCGSTLLIVLGLVLNKGQQLTITIEVDFVIFSRQHFCLVLLISSQLNPNIALHVSLLFVLFLQVLLWSRKGQRKSPLQFGGHKLIILIFHIFFIIEYFCRVVL